MTQSDAQKARQRWTIAIVVYAVLFFSILLIANLETVNFWLGKLLSLLAPLLIGLVLAYLANPFFRFFERKVFLRFRNISLRRILSLILTYLVLIAIIAGLIFLIIPQLITTVKAFAQKFHTYTDSLVGSLNDVISFLNGKLPPHEDGSPAIALLDKEEIFQKISSLWADITTWVKESFDISFLKDFLDSATRTVLDIFFGIFISVYFLASKEKRGAQIRKFRLAYLSDKVNERITRVVTIADSSFGGFLRGKILDSCIVGLLVYISCLIFGIPYALLVAVIVGITDIVPVIGPFIGVIPTAVIILLTDPVKVIIYVLIILVIQQIDGNIIAPKILGENTGVSSLCVLISILVMGDLMGLVGMVIGVPLFATVIELGKILLDRKLDKKGLSGDLDTYYPEETRAMLSEEPEEDEPHPEEPTVYATASPVGNLTDPELTQLRIYALARKHHIFTDLSDEALAEFAEESAALCKQMMPSCESVGKDGDNE